jgi:segregation and condensation protein B
MSLKAKLESVIYAAEEPVKLSQLAALFAEDALEWKSEQTAASAEQAAETAAAEAQSPLNEAFAYLELDPGAAAAPDVVTEGEELPAEFGEATGQEPSAETGEAESSPAEEPAAEGGAAPSDAEAKRQARQRDREVRAILRQLLDELIADYTADSRGIEIREIAGGFRMATKPECHDAVRQFVKSLKPALKLSLPALETLAVVAYKQPVTAPEVNEIRGVDSSAVFGSLLARKLIATAGRKPVIGRPILYKTTREFLLRFGLKDVSELPSMEEFEKMAAIEFEETESAAMAESAPEPREDLSLEFDETDSDEPEDEAGEASPENAQPSQTAAKADSNETPPTEEAAPAPPPPTEQAETENSPHGR